MNSYIIIGSCLIMIGIISFITYAVLGKAAGAKLKKELKEEY